jgi:beta-N-acetylglucosaminidase
VAVDTGLDWNTVISNESVVGRNVIQSNYPKGGTTLAPFSYLSTASGAYDWSTDKYTVKDGTNWYSANSSVIAYYMDPRNFLNDTDIFQFEALSYDASQSETVVQSILSNTFMKGNYSVVDSATGAVASGSYKQAFMDAGKSALANPYFLATRVKQEVGVNGSNATSGTYKGYEGLYNFYNIGANDGTNAVANGLLWAAGGTAKATTYGRPWTTPYKSIVGGAKYIAANYINVGQNTLYFQKFNVKPNDTKYLYLHQYMTNVQAPYSEGRTTRAAYNSLGILSNTMIFYIPVYSNMPASACALPASTGNPNPFLSDISVYNGSTKLSMSSTFVKPTSTGELSNSTYSVVVSKSVSQVTVTGSVISSKATLSGTGTVTLGSPGQTTTVTVSGIAQNGAKQDYTINITRNTK